MTGRSHPPALLRRTERTLRERIPAMLEKVGLKGVREHIRAELETWNEEAKVPLSAIGRTPAREVGR